MTFRRWYPTATTLADGRVLVTAGQRYGGYVANPPNPATETIKQAEYPEVYTANSISGNWQLLDSAQRRLPTYPWMFQAPDGRVFNAGPNYYTGWLNPTATAIGVTDAGKWSDGPPLPLWSGGQAPGAGDYASSVRFYGSAVMYRPGKILVLGGTDGQTVTNTTNLLDLTQASPAWQTGPDMRYPRYHVNTTLLADGSVLATGGSTQNQPH